MDGISFLNVNGFHVISLVLLLVVVSCIKSTLLNLCVCVYDSCLISKIALLGFPPFDLKLKRKKEKKKNLAPKWDGDWFINDDVITCFRIVRLWDMIDNTGFTLNCFYEIQLMIFLLISYILFFSFNNKPVGH